MKTKSGYETNGDYIKFKHYAGSWVVETSDEIFRFKTEGEADLFITTKIISCEKGYTTCKHFFDQPFGCDNCKFGNNSNCNNSEKINQ